jgi:hypothetical protein
MVTNEAPRHEGVWGSEYILVDPRFHEFGTSWRWVVSFRPLPLYLEERAPGTHWIGGWVGPRAGLDDVEKRKFLTLPGLELRPLCRPARSQSPYRMRYPGSHYYYYYYYYYYYFMAFVFILCLSLMELPISTLCCVCNWRCSCWLGTIMIKNRIIWF